MAQLAVLLLGFALSGLAEAAPADTPIAARLAPAMKSAAAKSKDQPVLLVVVADARSEPEPWLVICEIRDQMAALLGREGAKPVVNPAVEDLLLGMEVTGFPDARQVAAIRKAASLDRLLVGVYMRRGAARVLRLFLVQADTRRNLWTGSVRFAEADVAIAAYVSEVNRRVVKFAADHAGQQVGNGECWTLAAEALKDAGAKLDGAYGFGRKLGKRDAVLPGDVMQFEKARFAGKGHSVSMPHHTAIVGQVDGPTVFTLLHQNYGASGKTVSRLTIDVRELKEGTMEIFRPKAVAAH